MLYRGPHVAILVSLQANFRRRGILEATIAILDVGAVHHETDHQAKRTSSVRSSSIAASTYRLHSRHQRRHAATMATCGGWISEDREQIIKRSDKAKGFEVLPRRWVVERASRGLADAAG
jgi:hypothetical protein